MWAQAILPSIPERIDEGLTQSRVVLFFVSRQAVASDWARLKLDSARFGDPLNRTGRFIPVRLDDTDLPVTIRQFKHLSWREQSDDELAQLVAALRSETRSDWWQRIGLELHLRRARRRSQAGAILVRAQALRGILRGG